MSSPAARGAAAFASVVLIESALAHMERAFTYAVPQDLPLAVGSIVRVPFRGRKRVGVVVAFEDAPGARRTFDIAGTLGPGLPEELVRLARWLADRYLSSLGEALAAIVPARVASEEFIAPAAAPATARPGVPSLGGARNAQRLASALSEGRPERFVWRPRARESRGRVIASMVAQSLARDAGAIVLVPEVRTEADVVDALRDAFGDGVAWLSSNASARARYRDWLALRAGSKRIAVGGRSAVLAPVRDLGLIVVDDESHQAYKEARAPRFDARAVAAERAAGRATLVLIGIPPSIEARAAVATSRYVLVAPRRADEGGDRPPVVVVDTRAEDTRHVPASRTATLARRALEAGRRVVVVVHRAAELSTVGARFARITGAARPGVVDASTAPPEAKRTLGRADLVVATPVVAKDVALENVGMLVLLEVDAALAQPEFRAREDAFATWWRCARWLSDGSVVVETADPAQPAIVALTRWNPDVLWAAEAALRRELGYPPFAAVARVDVPDDRAAAVIDELKRASPVLDVVGPAEAPGGGRVVLARARRREDLVAALRPVVSRWRADNEPMRVDVDPREVLVPKWRSSRS